MSKVCLYCNRQMRGFLFPTRDHVVPKSRGGVDHPCNILIVCNRCNFDKADMMLGEFLGWLQHRNDYRAPIIERLMDIAINGDPELAVQVGVDIEIGKDRAMAEIQAFRGSLKRKIGYEHVH